MKKFKQGDILHSRIKTYPLSSFFIFNGNVYYNNKLNTGLDTPQGYLSLYEMNVARGSSNLIYPFKVKDNTLTSFRTISTGDYNNSFKYGDTIQGTYPLTASIYIDYHEDGSTRSKVKALRNITDYYKHLSPHYAYSSSEEWNKETIEMSTIEIPSIFYGSSIKKGSVYFYFYNSGSLVSIANDVWRNGEIIQTTGSNSGSVAGTILYNEGFVILTGSWSLNDSHSEDYTSAIAGLENPSWKYFGRNVSSSSYEVKFKGINYVDTVSMLCHAGVGELNNSNNPTFIDTGQTEVFSSGSSSYVENDKITIKNIVKSEHDNDEADFKKTTYISKIAIYDEQKNVIGIAKVATPVKKTEERDFSFRIKMDI